VPLFNEASCLLLAGWLSTSKMKKASSALWKSFKHFDGF
jgi:hypothetical protein